MSIKIYISACFLGVLSGIMTSVVGQVLDETKLIAPGAQLEKLGDGYSFTEGPIADRNGDVFFTDQPNNRIMKWEAATGRFSIFLDKAGRSNGMFFDAKGKLIACADDRNELWSIDRKGKHKVLVSGRNGGLLNGPNDVWVHPGGDIYFTDPLYERDYWVRNHKSQQDGEHVYLLREKSGELVVLDTKVVKPNGIIGSPDGSKLYVADIGDQKIYMYRIGKDGTVSDRVLAAPMGADGITLDEKGNLYLAGKGVTVFNPEGKKIAYIPVGNGWTANVTFGGKDRKLLFMTAGNAVYGLKMNVRGAY